MGGGGGVGGEILARTPTHKALGLSPPHHLYGWQICKDSPHEKLGSEAQAVGGRGGDISSESPRNLRFTSIRLVHVFADL